MASFKVEKKGYQLIVKVRLRLNEKLNENSLNDFSQKFVIGLLKAKKINKKKIEYTGPIGISLYNRLETPMSKHEFFFIMEQFVDLFQKMGQARLDISKIVPDLKNIYINGQTKQIQFIYLPLQTIQNTNLLEIMYNIIYKVKPMAEQDDGYISRFMYFLQKLKYFEPDKIGKYIAKEKNDNNRTGLSNDEEATGLLNDEEATGLLSDEEPTGLLNDEEPTGLLNDEEKTSLLNDEEPTGLLKNDNYISFATLYRTSTGESIQIDKFVFRLGREKSSCDYFIQNNNAVSQRHANIITRGRQRFIVDLNSLNRTFVNEMPIPSGQEIELYESDSIKLGNEEFIFHT